jgi:type II secretory pathway component HofQ
MATGKQLKAAMRVRRTAKGPRKKRTRPEPQQYTVVDLERARDRVAAAERRIENDRSGNPNRGRVEAGAARAVRHRVATTLPRPSRVMNPFNSPMSVIG